MQCYVEASVYGSIYFARGDNISVVYMLPLNSFICPAARWSDLKPQLSRETQAAVSRSSVLFNKKAQFPDSVSPWASVNFLHPQCPFTGWSYLCEEQGCCWLHSVDSRSCLGKDSKPSVVIHADPSDPFTDLSFVCLCQVFSRLTSPRLFSHS